MKTKTIYFLNFLFILFCTFILVSNIFLKKYSLIIFLGLTILYLLTLSFIKIKNHFYYLFVIIGFFISYIITKIHFFEAILILIIFAFFVIIFNLLSKIKGIEAKVIDSGEKYSIVEVKSDIITRIKPGYYILEEKLEKGTKIRIKEIDFFKNARIKKYVIVDQ